MEKDNKYQNFPTNSYIKKIKKDAPEKKLKRVVKGGVIKKKKSLSKRATEIFLGDNLENVSNHIFYDVAIPAIKNGLLDGLEMLLFGKKNIDPRNRGGYNKPYRSYDKYFDSRKGGRQISHRGRIRHDFDEICIENQVEALETLDILVNLTQTHGVATVADLYNLVGIKSEYTDDAYGWDNLDTARVVEVRGGYLLDLPAPILLEY